jgi:hypothetical protein
MDKIYAIRYIDDGGYENFFTSETGKYKWSSMLRKAKFYGQKGIAQAIATNMKNHPERFGLDGEDSRFINIMEFALDNRCIV